MGSREGYFGTPEEKFSLLRSVDLQHDRPQPRTGRDVDLGGVDLAEPQ